MKEGRSVEMVQRALVFAWLFLQALLGEIDLIQRIPEYQETMRQATRFIPRLGR